MLVRVLRLFVVVIFVTMAMEVMRDTCVQSIMTIRTTISNLYAAMLAL